MPGWRVAGPKLYLIGMIDDAISRLHARFVLHDENEQNMRMLWSYVEQNGRPLGFYTDKTSLFRTAPKSARDKAVLPCDEREPLPPTQIGRALRNWIWFGLQPTRHRPRGASKAVSRRRKTA